jgi:hypothetical protein
MRRVLSVVFLAFGGYILMGEPLVAFLNMHLGGEGAQLLLALVWLITAAIPLAIGTLISPGDRRRELGLTVLIAMGAALFCGISCVAVFTDPGFKPYMANIPMPDFGFAPVTGIMNFIVLSGIGWLLYQGRRTPAALG